MLNISNCCCCNYFPDQYRTYPLRKLKSRLHQKVAILQFQSKAFRIILKPKKNISNKVAKIRNRYNQVPHLTQDTNGKVINQMITEPTHLLKSTNAQPLHVRRIKQMACEVFKIINKMSPEYINLNL